MSARSKVAPTSGLLLALAIVLLSACSSSEPRDMWGGTDAGQNYTAPDLPLKNDVVSAEVNGAVEVQAVEVQAIDVEAVDSVVVDSEATDTNVPVDAEIIIDSSATAGG
jgi:PBP1b-binding outer membrane lipoprotein LpoB